MHVDDAQVVEKLMCECTASSIVIVPVVHLHLRCPDRVLQQSISGMPVSFLDIVISNPITKICKIKPWKKEIDIKI